MPDDDRRAVAARLATTGAATVDALAAAVADGEELREVLVDVDGEVVALTATRALLVQGTDVRPFDYGAVAVRRRAEGLGIDALVEGDTLVLDVARSTFVRLGVLAQGSPPGRATWLPARTPAAPQEPTPRPDRPDRPEQSAGHLSQAPHPASVVPSPPDARPIPPRPAAAAVPEPPRQALPPPGWHPDPSGRHWWRWWDGRGWTEHVADGGAPYVDPLPPR